MGQERPDLLQSILAHPFLLTGALALTGLVAKYMLAQHAPSYQQPSMEQLSMQQQYAMNGGSVAPPMDEAFYQQTPYPSQDFNQPPLYDNNPGYEAAYSGQEDELRQEIESERREEREMRKHQQ